VHTSANLNYKTEKLNYFTTGYDYRTNEGAGVTDSNISILTVPSENIYENRDTKRTRKVSTKKQV
jgi:hypothetical protein